MQKIIKYILVTISFLLIVLVFIKYLNITNEGFYTNGNLLNKIKPGCDPTHPILHPTNDSNNCDCGGKHIDQYALYNSNDDNIYNSIAKCEYINKNKSEWSSVTNQINYDPIGHRDCKPSQSSTSPNNSDYKYACQPNVNSNVFALWDGKKWITSNANESYNKDEYDWINGRNYPPNEPSPIVSSPSMSFYSTLYKPSTSTMNNPPPSMPFNSIFYKPIADIVSNPPNSRFQELTILQ